MKTTEKYIRIHINSEGVLIAYTKPISNQEDDKAVKVFHLRINYGQRLFDWPTTVGLQDLKHVGDLYDFHLLFPYDAWARGACKDSMTTKIG